jgi:hypothetical protein
MVLTTGVGETAFMLGTDSTLPTTTVIIMDSETVCLTTITTMLLETMELGDGDKL